jgi:uncharacterized membrane protein YjjP (DUF1212 family)
MTTEISETELANILSTAMAIGKLMLESGAASFRTEQAVMRVGRLLGVDQLECYVTPTGIIATAYTAHTSRTQIVRILRFGVDMNRILELELLSRTKSPITRTELVKRIETIKAQGPLYPPLVTMLAVGFGCGALALLFGGTWREGVGALLGAFAAQGVRMRLHHQGLNPIPLTVMCSTVATVISVIVVRLINAPLPQIGVTASVLLLAPGVPLVTAVVDLSRFYLLSGMSRGMQTMLIFVSIAVGLLVGLVLTGFNIL